jgi:hypothetical protein
MAQLTEERIHRVIDEKGPVLTCAVTDCSYNRFEACHAPGIAVGDVHPACDTFTVGPASISSEEACVMECKVSDCAFNADLNCHAAGVTVSFHSAHADCITFREHS